MEQENITPAHSKKRGLKILLVSVLILTPVLYFGVNKVGVEMDRKERIPHANCEIFDKSKIDRQDLYLIKTSCGDYEAIERMYGFVKVGQEYDMQVTKGNWARNPRLAIAGGCANPSQEPIPSPVPNYESPGFSGGGMDG